VYSKKTFAVLSIFAISFSAVFLLGLAQQQGEQYVVINAQEVLVKSNMGQQIQKEMEGMQQREQQRLEGMQEEVKQLEQRATNPSLSEADRQSLVAQLQNKRTGLQRAYEDAQRYFQKESQKKLQDLERRIMPVIEAVARENGFKMVFDVSSSGIAYSDPGVNITDLVVQRLNSMR